MISGRVPTMINSFSFPLFLNIEYLFFYIGITGIIGKVFSFSVFSVFYDVLLFFVFEIFKTYYSLGSDLPGIEIHQKAKFITSNT